MALRLTATADELRRRFSSLQTLSDLANLLEISQTQLRRYSYGRGRQYRTFAVKKRRGGERKLQEPSSGLKVVQQKLNQIFTAVYDPPASVHGFVPNQSIATNANVHRRQTWVLNIDLKDFFPTINFGRVRGMLMARPYSLPRGVATVIAQLCCHDNALPQGAPTSPVVSNMVCAKLDAYLDRLGRRYRCRYSRYADDITLSCSRGTFPEGLASLDRAGSPSVSLAGPLLAAVIEANGFEVNVQKVRLRRSHERQEVTGLTANAFPNVQRSFVRRIRAMLHAWEKFGHDEAGAHHFGRHDTKDRGPHAAPEFRRVVNGHLDFLAMVRGNDHVAYRRLLEHYARLDGRYTMRPAVRVRRNHLRTHRDAIWVLECWDPFFSQGTAFELKGVGLVTCAHVVLDDEGAPTARDLVAYQPRAEGIKIPVRVVAHDRDSDLAILEFDAPSGIEFVPKYAPRLEAGERVRATGFPNYGPGSTLIEAEGSVVGHHEHIGSPRYLVNCPIVSGASGGPVFDASSAVVGVASQGEETLERAVRGLTVKFGVIPIGLLRCLPNRGIAP